MKESKYRTNIDLRQLERLLTVEKLKSFYLKKDIKAGKLVRKDDVKESLKKMIEHFEEVYKGVFTSDTQLDNMVSKSEKEIREVLERQTNLYYLEMAYGELPYKYSESVRKVFREEIRKNINLDFNSPEEYKKEIIRLLETDEDIVRVYLDEIKDICQSEIVIIFLTICNNISGLPKRDRKKIYDDKKSFNNEKEKVIRFLKKHRINYDEVTKLAYDNKEEFGSTNYEKSLKHYKEMLSNSLIENCNATKTSAKEISNILEYL